MIELVNDTLCFLFPHLSPDARLNVTFVRTLRIPDDDSTYPWPPGLGNFPLVHVDDHAQNVPGAWIEHGGVMLPMYRSEALWVKFSPGSPSRSKPPYPFAVKLAAGKVNALTGEGWTNSLQGEPQDYAVAPPQAHIDGYCVKKGVVRQFLAMPLGEGYTAEEQLADQARYGGIQICAYPMRTEEYERRLAQSPPPDKPPMVSERQAGFEVDMGLGLGGLMGQDICRDPYGLDVWDAENMSRCFVHMADSALWEAVTGEKPPDPPPSAKQYNEAGLPWYENKYSPTPAHHGSEILEGLKSVSARGLELEKGVLPENESLAPSCVAPSGRSGKDS